MASNGRASSILVPGTNVKLKTIFNMLIEYKNRQIIVLPNVTTIENSFQIRSIKEMKHVINSARAISKNHHKKYKEYAIHVRTMFSMICEWRAHNLLWSLGIKRERTKTVDLELKVKWYYKIGYFILSCCYLRW